MRTRTWCFRTAMLCACMLGIATSAMADQGAVQKIPVAVMDARGNLLSDVASLASLDSRGEPVEATSIGMGIWEIETLATARKVTLLVYHEEFGSAEAEVVFPNVPPTMVQVYLQGAAPPRVDFVLPQAPVRGPTTVAEMPAGAAPVEQPVTVDATVASAPGGIAPPAMKVRQGGDTCATAAPIPGLPFSATGTTVGYANDYDEVCPYTGSTAPDVVYSYTPTADVTVKISCCTDSAYDTKLYVYEGTCASPYYACNDDACSTPSYPSAYVSELNNVSMTAGTMYYIVIDGYGTASGSYTLDVTEVVPCVVDCPPGANLEGEACGSDTNGGCNMTTPAFEPISIGDTVCGTIWADGGTRDTDWYEVVTTAAATEFTWSVEAEFPVVIGLVEMNTPGSGNCADSTGYLNPYALAGECVPVSVVTTLPAGTHWFFVSHQTYYDWPCDSNNDYAATLTGVEITTGACCDPDPPYNCYPDKTLADCEALFPGGWQGAGTDCDPNPCLPCADEVINLGDTVSGTTCGMIDDWSGTTCLGYYDGGEDYIYEFTLTDPTIVSITMDPLGTTWTGIALADTCPPGGSCIAYDTGSSGVREIDCVPLNPGTYYIMVDTWPSPDCIPSFNLTLEVCVPCVLDCPPGASQEPEPCGSDTNGGCNMAIPTFTPISCGETVCGTVWADGGTRDTDWYEVVITEDMELTWAVEAEFDVVIGFVETVPYGSGDCADSTGYLNPYAVAGDCQPISVVTQCVPPGTYWAFVSHQTYYDWPCDSFNDYVATLTCTPCYLPPGACCAIDGTCTEVPELQCSGLWMGEGTTCDPNPCIAMADYCEDAIPIDVPSVTPGTTQGATTDTGFPLCVTSITSPGVWFSVTGTGNTMTADLCNGATTYDSKLCVYCPDCVEPLCVTGNDDYCGLQSQVSWCSQYGANYLILVHGYGGATGPFELTVTDDGVPCQADVQCLPVGACCLPNAACVETTEMDCDMQGGEYQGDGSDCSGFVVAPPCTDPDATITVTILTDYWGYETSWQLVEVGVGTIASGSGYDDETLYVIDVPVCSASCYNFTIYDAYGDGIYAPGGYEIAYEGMVVASTLGSGWSGSEESVTGIGPGCAGGAPGACCLPVGTIADCIVTIEACCDYAGGDYLGDGTNCGTATIPVLDEDFNAGIPAGWTVVDDDGSGVIWDTNVYWGDPNWTGGDGMCAEASSDNFGTASYDTSLYTPVMDLSAGFNQTLSCLVNFQNFAGYDYFYIDVSFDAGMNWSNLLTWNEDHGTFHGAPGEAVTLALGGGTATTQLRFRFYDPVPHWNWEVQVDDVLVTMEVAGDNPCPLYPSIDMPGECPKPFNRSSHGVLPVMLVGDPDFDVTLVDISTLHIFRADGVGGSVAPNEGPPGPATKIKDLATVYNGEPCGCRPFQGDGIDDLSMKFNTDEMVAALEMDDLAQGAIVELVVGGNLLDGTEFHAEDCVRLVPPGAPPGQLTVTSSVPGVWIESDPLDLQMDGGGYTDFQRNFPAGTMVTLTAPDSIAGRAFTRWVVDGVLYPTGVTTIQIPIVEGLNSVELEVKFRPPNIPPRQNDAPDRLLGF